MSGPPLTVLHMDADLVAIDKPACLLVHPSALDAHEERTAVGLLQQQLGDRLFPLHRLDKGTSGVLLFARTAHAARHWGIAFARGEIAKRYLALVRGWPPEAGTIDYPLARDPELPSAGQARVEALTHYRRLACFDWPFSADGRHPSSRYALVEVDPATGRRHQIRRHFKHIAHPLVGDTTHGKSAHNRAVAAFLGVQRLWLHAASVELPGGLRISAACGGEWGGSGLGRACLLEWHRAAAGIPVLRVGLAGVCPGSLAHRRQRLRATRPLQQPRMDPAPGHPGHCPRRGIHAGVPLTPALSPEGRGSQTRLRREMAFTPSPPLGERAGVRGHAGHNASAAGGWGGSGAGAIRGCYRHCAAPRC